MSVDSLKERFVTCLTVKSGKDLDLSALELDACPRQVEQNERLHALLRLDLSFNRLTRLPDLQRLTKLAILHASGNALAALDAASFGALTRLRDLALTGNRLAALPDTIGGFTKLERLNVANNRLSALPNELGYCCALVELRASQNPLRSLPRTVRSLESLEHADFAFGQLSALPSELTLCSRLLELDVSNNQLQALPSDIGRMSRLTTLDISGNKISELPLSMGMCRSLGELGAGVQLDGNPIKNEQLLKARRIGPDHLMFFLEKRMEAVGVPRLPDIPWHNLLERRDNSRRRMQDTGVSINMGSYGTPSTSTSAAAAAAHKTKHAEDVRKVDALKRWAREQINTVFAPKLRKIRTAVDRFETLEQGQGLAAYVQRVAPRIAALVDTLPDLEPLDPDPVDPDLPPIGQLRARLRFGCANAKHVLEGCELVLSTTGYADTIVPVVKALKELQTVF